MKASRGRGYSGAAGPPALTAAVKGVFRQLTAIYAVN
jgi:hypothetical protein